MKKLILFLILLFTLDISAQVTRASLWEWVSAQIIQSRTGVTSVLPSATNAVNFGASGTIWNLIYGDTLNLSGQANALSLFLNNNSYLYADAANRLSMRNGLNSQEFRITYQYEDADSSSYARFYYSGNEFNIRTTRTGIATNIGAFNIGTGANVSMGFVQNDLVRWQLVAGGHWYAPTDNTYDFGQSGNKARIGYFGTSVDIGDNGSTSGQLNFIASDNDQANIAINTSDQITFNSASGGYKFDAGSLILSGNISANAWTTNGIGLVRQAGTFTDLTSSGTVAAAYTNVLGGNTIAASNATTFTNYYTTYINAPIAGTNVTITNPYALGVGGNTLQTGNLSVQSSLITDERVVTLADSASISIATGTAGFGRVMIGDNQEEAEIKWKADGTVTLIRNSTNVASDGTTDDTLNIYDGGDGIVIKNLLGSSLKLAISLKYYTP